MTLQPIYGSLCILIGLVTLSLAFVMAQRQNMRGSFLYSALLVSTGIWLMFHGLQVWSWLTPEVSMLWGKLKYLGSLPTPLLWAAFCWQYSEGRLRWPVIAGLSIVPALTLLAVIFGEFNPAAVSAGQINFEYLLTLPQLEQIILVLNLISAYGLTLVGIFLMAQQVLKLFKTHRAEGRLLLVAIALPVITAVAVNMRLLDINGALDHMPLAFGVMLILITRLFTTSDVMSMTPIAYDTVVDSLPDAMIALDLEGRIVSLNAAAQRLLGTTSKQLIGTPLRQVEVYAPAFAQILLRARDGEQEVQLGEQYWEITRRALYTPEGAPSGLLYILREITASKHADIALQTNERRYIALFENSNDAIFIIDMSEAILIANERAGLMLHQPLDDLMGSKISKYIAPADAAKNQQHFRTLMMSGFTPIYETTLVRTDGQQLTAEMSLTLVRDMSGEPRHIQAIARDITERKRIEKSLNTRLELSAVLQQVDEELNSSLKVDHVVQVALDAAMRLSRAQAGYIGIIDDEELRVTYMIGKYPPEMLNSVVRHDVGIAGRVLVNQIPELVPDVAKDPDYVAHIPGMVSMMMLPLISQERLVGVIQLLTNKRDVFNDEIFGIMMLLSARIAVSIDNSRLHDYVIRQLDETQILYKQVSRLEGLKTDMIRIASHDLKAPLHIIDGYIELLKEDKSQFDEFYWSYFDAMGRAVARMQQMLTDILSLERINQRAEGQHDEEFGLMDLVETAVAEFKPLAQAKQQTFITNIAPDTPMVEGDKTQLYEAITNLISNAIKYTPSEGTITISLSCEDEKISFRVQDTGYGIPADRQERLFEPFYRARVEGTESTEGTGLGLHLVKNVVERHGGTMMFKSEFQKGSLFGFTLPSAALRASLSPATTRPDA